MNIKIKGLSIKEISKCIMKLRLSDEKIFSYIICMDREDYSADDIISVIKDVYLCRHEETKNKIINIIKQSILTSIYDNYVDKWCIYDKVNEIFDSLSIGALRELIMSNIDVIQMYMATEDFSEDDRAFFQPRTFCFNNFCMNDEHQLIRVPANVRWYYFNSECELTNFLSKPFVSAYLFLGDDFPKCKYYIDYKQNKDEQCIELAISDDLDPDNVKSAFGKNIV